MDTFKIVMFTLLLLVCIFVGGLLISGEVNGIGLQCIDTEVINIGGGN